jgi:predicted DNA-binding transcriptional regulator YafY
MLLQSRGRMTAQELAEVLDVSERTIYRDIDALCSSGVPIYPEYGPGGGFALLDSYRTNLTGMTQNELSALFMLSVPSPFEKLGISQELRSALLKLSAALPAARRASEEQAHNRFLIDWEGFHAEEPVPHLRVIQEAVWKNQRLLISFRVMRDTPIADVPADPYALVAKAGEWFLIAMRAGRLDVLRIANLTGVRAIGETFTRQPDFDLTRYWNEWCQGYQARRKNYPVKVRLAPEALSYLPLYFGYRATEWFEHAETSQEDGWITITVTFESLQSARGQLLSLGRAVEVLEPLALRCSLIDYAAQVSQLYRERGAETAVP